MSDTQIYDAVTPALWEHWLRRLPRLAEMMGATDVHFDGGDNGQFCFRLGLGIIGGDFELAYDYDATAETVEITILRKPFMVSDSMIFDAIDSRIYPEGVQTP